MSQVLQYCFNRCTGTTLLMSAKYKHCYGTLVILKDLLVSRYGRLNLGQSPNGDIFVARRKKQASEARGKKEKANS